MSDVLRYFRENQATIIGWFGWHAWLSVAPVVLGLVIALPLGWLASRHRWAYPPLITAAGLLYTIPSVTLFVVLPGLLHTKILDPVNVIVALTVYTVALLVRVVADGLAAVPDDVQQAATAMGYRGVQRLFAVELPMATPVIAAGLRVAAVSNVSLVSISVITGVDQLGKLFFYGIQLSYPAPLILGVLGCLVLALLIDAVILTLTRWLTPWRRVTSR